MNSIAHIDHDEQDHYGEANPRRGANHVDTALAFIRDFPIGSTLSTEDFDRSGDKMRLFSVPVGYPKKSDTWLAHLQRRHQARYNINKAGAHPRMKDLGSNAFVIEFVTADVYEVRSPEVAISKNQIAKSMDSLFRTKKKNLAHLLQSADWDLLPPHEKAFAESLWDDIAKCEQSINLETSHLAGKYEKLRSKLDRAVESGAIQPKNHGIRQLIAPELANDGADA